MFHTQGKGHTANSNQLCTTGYCATHNITPVSCSWTIMPHASKNERRRRGQRWKRWPQQQQPRCSASPLVLLNQRRRGIRSRSIRRRARIGLWGLAAVVLGAAVRRVECQSYVNGGEVAVDCNSCDCQGDSDDGSVVVFDNPSSGSRVSRTRTSRGKVAGERMHGNTAVIGLLDYCIIETNMAMQRILHITHGSGRSAHFHL